jgi:hypothetical protein
MRLGQQHALTALPQERGPAPTGGDAGLDAGPACMHMDNLTHPRIRSLEYPAHSESLSWPTGLLSVQNISHLN